MILIESITKIIANNRPLRFILVGGLNTIIGYLLFAMLISIGLPYYYAMLLTSCIGVVINFKTTGYLVFNNRDNKLLLKFITIYALIYVFNIILIHSLESFIQNLYICGIISIIASSVVSYFCNKKFIFT